MELWQLGALVGFGVSLIVFLVHLSGGSRKALLESDTAVASRFADDFPLLKAGQIIRTQTGNAGFLLFNDGTTGLVHAVGDAYLTRHLTKASIKSSSCSGENLHLRLDDFTFPAADYQFATAGQALALQQRLAP
jgi:hypothetical protein